MQQPGMHHDSLVVYGPVAALAHSGKYASAWKAIQQSKPEIPDAYLAVIACRHDPVLLLMSKVNVSNRHQMCVCNLANTLHATNVPDLPHTVSVSLSLADNAAPTEPEGVSTDNPDENTRVATTHLQCDRACST